MKRLRLLLGLLVLTVTTPTTSGAVSERDLVPGSGDGLLTFDDVNNREWLDLSQSLLIDLGETDAGGEFTFDFDRDAVAELEPGGLFEGFTVAKSEDVVALAQSAGIDTSMFDFDANQAATANLIDLLEPTVFTHFSVVLIDERDGLAVASAFLFIRNSGAGLITGFNAGPDGIRFPNAGVMLYRQVPEPAAFILCAVSILVTANSRLRNRQQVRGRKRGRVQLLTFLSYNFNQLIDQQFIDGDFNGDGAVDGNDVSWLSYFWGTNLQNLWVLGDFDGDFDVDDSNIVVINQNFGMTAATRADGDLDGNGVVDLADLDLAFAQYSMDLDVVS